MTDDPSPVSPTPTPLPAAESAAEASKPAPAAPWSIRKRKKAKAAERWERLKEKSWRTHVSVPAILYPSIKVRWAEFAYRTFSPFAVELVCFDLRKRVDHDVTHPLSIDLQPVQDAVDRRIVTSYAPGRERHFGLIDRLLNRDPEVLSTPVIPIPSMAAKRTHIFFPRRLQPLIEIRWRELGYDGLSAYVTGLIRYDLALGGPHKYFNGKDTDPELLAALDARTEREFHAHRRQRILLDYLVERAAGREMSDEERTAAKRRVAERLRAISYQPRVGKM